jgi:L-fuconolactonase
MVKIDSHQHFWKFDPVRDSWINEEMSVIQRDFLPEDLEPVLKENDIDGCVTVQSDQSEAENEFQLSNAAKHDFIKGVVGWVDLQAENVEERLQYYKDFKKMKGFRHVLQGEPQRDFMLRNNFKRGVGLLNKYGFTYDVLIYTDQLTYTYEFVKAFPEQRFVIDHLAKPFIKDKKTDGWKKGIEKISECENVYCKLSGMVTEAGWRSWKKEDFTPYLDIVTEAFETKRIMYGSDWPVCLVAASYKAMLSIVTDYFSSYTDSEKAQIFGQNATQFYNLD